MRPTLTHLPRPRSNFSAPSVIFVISVFAWDGIRMEILSVKRNPRTFKPRSFENYFIYGQSEDNRWILGSMVHLDQVLREEILFFIN